MASRKAKADDTPRELQRQLPFSREERLTAIDSIRPESLGCTKVQTNRLKGLLVNLEYIAGSEGCFPTQQLIAARMGVDVRTIGRLVAMARQLGLVDTQERVIPRVGNRSLHYYVNWCKVVSLATPEEPENEQAQKCPTAPKNVRPPLKNVVARSDNLSERAQTLMSEPIVSSESIRNTSSSNSSPAASPISVTDAEWQQLEEEVFQRGVDQAEPAIAAAVTAGCTASHLRAIIATHQRKQLGPGALYQRLITARPSDDPERGWPASSPAKPQPIDRQREFAHAAAENVRLDRWKAGWNIIKRLRGQQIPDDQIADQLPQFGFTREELEF